MLFGLLCINSIQDFIFSKEDFDVSENFSQLGKVSSPLIVV